MPDTLPVSGPLDELLRKYGKIWIWSILSAAVGALSMRLISGGTIAQVAYVNNYGAHAQMVPSFTFVSLAVVAPSITTVVSVYYLLLFLKHHILPILFPAQPPAELPAEVYAPPEEPPDGAQLLYRAFAAVLIAMLLEVGIALSAIVFRALA